jgi:hypothetical protein
LTDPLHPDPRAPRSPQPGRVARRALSFVALVAFSVAQVRTDSTAF